MRRGPLVLAVGAALAALAISARAAVLLNELLVNPQGGTQDAREYVEIRSTGGGGSATNLWLLQINSNPDAAGVVHDKWYLGDLSFGENGLLLIGNNYDNNPNGGPWSDLVSHITQFGDPTYFGAGDLLNTAYTWMIVSNCSAAVTNGLDLDVNDDGVFDSAPWDAILDSVGWKASGATGIIYSPASLAQSSGTPDAATRFPDNDTPLSQNAWYNGDVTTNSADSQGRQYMGAKASTNLPAGACLTPGDLNYPHPPASASIRINEVYINPPGIADEREFIELSSSTGGRESLWDLWLLVIDSAGGSIGTVQEAWNLSGLATGPSGLAILGNKYGYPSRGGPWSNVVAAATVSSEPAGVGSSGWGNGDIQDNDDFTLMLVSGFTGQPGDDLDVNDDLSFDSTPWSNVVDSVGFGQTYALAPVNPGFAPDAVARLAGNGAANSAAAWCGGDILGADLSLSFDPAKIFNLPAGAELTPGNLNYPISNDTDGDGIPDAWELQYFGGSTNASPTADPDLDGYNNRQEHIADTNPTNAASHFGAISNGAPGTAAWPLVVDPTSPDRVYDVVWRTNLLETNWWPSGFDVPGNGGAITLEVQNVGNARFYRTNVKLP